MSSPSARRRLIRNQAKAREILSRAFLLQTPAQGIGALQRRLHACFKAIIGELLILHPHMLEPVRAQIARYRLYMACQMALPVPDLYGGWGLCLALDPSFGNLFGPTSKKYVGQIQ